MDFTDDGIIYEVRRYGDDRYIASSRYFGQALKDAEYLTSISDSYYYYVVAAKATHENPSHPHSRR